MPERTVKPVSTADVARQAIERLERDAAVTEVHLFRLRVWVEALTEHCQAMVKADPQCDAVTAYDDILDRLQQIRDEDK